jgi:NAD(P)-dependent dehydrogenase (short-subunit alcohol dehydrogenase family)
MFVGKVANPYADCEQRPLTNALDFTGRTVLVTGGSQGIGRAIAERFLEQGADVVVCARNTPQSPPGAGGRAAEFVTCDVRDADAVAQLIETVVTRWGRIDVLVNNAGGSPGAEAATHSPRFFDKIIELNLSAAFYCAQSANARMQQQPEGGCIVNIASVSALRASPGTAAYGAAKAGLLNLTQSLAMEWGPKVRVNAIVAGLIVTGNAEAHYGGPAGLARVAASLPARRMGAPGDIADACLYLASPLAAYVSGAALAVHGGGERPSFLDLALDRDRN